jgi:hypothetical protein
MGLFTSKIAIGVLAGGFTLAGAGLLFNGSETLQNASNFVKMPAIKSFNTKTMRTDYSRN